MKIEYGKFIVIAPQVCESMLALKDKCIHPVTQEKYVKSYGGGRDNSPEGLQVSYCRVLGNIAFEFSRHTAANDAFLVREDSRMHS
jgi:hypothetical protein